MYKFKKYLKSTDFAVILLVLSCITQGFHSFFIFNDLSNFSEIPRIISSIFYAIILSSAILFFTMINKRNVILVFLLFESSVNLYYFFKGIVIMLQMNQISWFQLLPRSAIAIGISIILPYTIYQYASSSSNIKEDKIQDEIKLSNYTKEKIKLDSKRSLLKQINSMDDIKKLNRKYFKEEKDE